MRTRNTDGHHPNWSCSGHLLSFWENRIDIFLEFLHVHNGSSSDTMWRDGPNTENSHTARFTEGSDHSFDTWRANIYGCDHFVVHRMNDNCIQIEYEILPFCKGKNDLLCDFLCLKNEYIISNIEWVSTFVYKKIKDCLFLVQKNTTWLWYFQKLVNFYSLYRPD